MRKSSCTTQETTKKEGILSREEEYVLGMVIRDGSPEDRLSARNRLAEANQGLVWSIAKAYQDRGLDMEDLVSFGNRGLITASEKFNPTLGYRFSTYASSWIHQAIERAIDTHAEIIREPIKIRALKRKLAAARQQFLNEYGIEPVAEELSDMTGVPVSKILDIYANSHMVCSLDMEIDDEGKKDGFDLIEDTRAADPVAICENIDLQEKIAEVLKMIKPVERKVLTLRFGLEGYSALSLQEIGDELGLSRERVRQIENAAIYKIRNNRIAVNLLKDYICEPDATKRVI